MIVSLARNKYILVQKFLPFTCFKMNCQQALFILSFLSTLSVLLFSFHWLRGKLRETGYDVSRLILIGLEPKINTTQFSDDTSRIQMAFGIDCSYTQLVAL